MKLINYQTFLNIAKYRNLSRVSEVMDTSPSTILRRIQSLEDDYETKLVKSHPKGIELTSKGMLFGEHCYNTLNMDDELRRRLGCDSDHQFKLTIGINPSLGDYLVSEMMTDSISNIKDMSVHVSFLSHEQSDNLKDLVLYLLPSNIVAENYDKVHVHSSDFLFCASEQYLHKHGSIGDINELYHHQTIYTEVAYSRDIWTWQHISGRSGILPIEPKYRSMSFQMSSVWLQQNLGVTLLPPSMAIEQKKNGAQILFGGFYFSRVEMYLYIRRDYLSSPEVKQVVDEILTYFSRLK
ncbi:LysR family transcriptional regulator [Ferrimonas pelagia]|uniref:LysR family transcriptional regulator n=1 Tax=Ferrimonas pelagia TaxID=1177826 RepID=A0ABP9EWE2_9GAMM